MIKIVFFGTPDIGLKSLKYLFNSEKIEVSAVVTQPDKPSGRGYTLVMSPLKQFALENNIPVFQPKSIRKEPVIIEALEKIKPDFFVTFAFGQILSQEVLDIPKYETINLHASLLPKYRGANPIQRAIINGDKETGICTMITEAGLDCGNICLCEKIEIPENMNFEQLHDIIAEKSPVLIRKTLLEIYDRSLISIPQNHSEATIAPKINKEDAKIIWSKSACEIHNLVRGIYKAPGAFTFYKGRLIKVMETNVIEGGSTSSKCGEVISVDKLGINVATGNGVLKILRVKPEGKGEMLVRDWANGSKIVIGEVFE